MQGNNRRVVFRDDRDKYAFLAILASVKSRFPFQLHHYCVMDNHYHLQLVALEGGPSLSLIMRFINHTYALYHKKRYDYSGHLWGGRFFDGEITTDRRQLTCGAYVELNPVRAGMVSRPEEYRWSSYRYYSEGRRDTLVDEDPSYTSAAGTVSDRRLVHRKHVLMAMGMGTLKMLSGRLKG